MRVIAGIAKGRKLSSFKGSAVRPTSDRARECLFNILGEKAKGSSFLDLFAGSGAMGIEALSRNAANATFLESDALSIELINKNLEKCDFPNKDFEIIQKDVLAYLKNSRNQFDIIFVDPPYKTDLAEKTLYCLSKKKLLNPGGIIVVEHYFKKDLKEEINDLKCIRKKKVGDAMFSLYNTP